MDPLTHSLTGLFLSRAGLHRFTPAATPILLLAANAPDIDIVALAGGPLNWIEWHRHFTHAALFAPVLAIAVALVVRYAGRQRVLWLGAFLVALAGVASHLLLDLTNVYGVRLLLPFSGQWLRWDLTPVIDVSIWAMLLLCVIGPLIAKLVSGEIGANVRGRGPARGWAIFGLIFVLLYNSGRAVLHTRATAMLDARIYNNASPLRVAAFPSASPLRWHGLAETRDAYDLFDMDMLGSFDPTAGQVFYKGEQTPFLTAAAQTGTFRKFLTFNQYPLWRSLPDPALERGTRVELMDLRFGNPITPGFVATAILDSRAQVVQSWFQFGAARPR